ncbi:MAG: asparagine synthase-related protein, partial [Candidatus Sulfotelmatobacter sp.]
TKLAERVGVPREALHRPKQGFALPLLHWMRHELKELVVSLLLDPSTLQRGYFNEQGVRHLLDEFLSGRTDDYLPIWRLMMFELWQRNFLQQFRMDDADEQPNCVACSPPGIG